MNDIKIEIKKADLIKMLKGYYNEKYKKEGIVSYDKYAKPQYQYVFIEKKYDGTFKAIKELDNNEIKAALTEILACEGYNITKIEDIYDKETDIRGDVDYFYRGINVYMEEKGFQKKLKQ